MRKKQFLALAEAIKAHNLNLPEAAFTSQQIELLAAFCQSQNPEFKRERWLSDLASQ